MQDVSELGVVNMSPTQHQRFARCISDTAERGPVIRRSEIVRANNNVPLVTLRDRGELTEPGAHLDRGRGFDPPFAGYQLAPRIASGPTVLQLSGYVGLFLGVTLIRQVVAEVLSPTDAAERGRAMDRIVR
jgi:hypothetical protein